MKRTIALLLCALILLTPCACGNDPTPTIEQSAPQTHDEAPKSTVSEKGTDYQKLLEKKAKQYHFEGTAIITKDGEKLAEFSAGYKNSEETKPIDTNTLFCIGSVTKEFTSAAILLLKEDGKLSLDDTLDSYFPNYDIGRDITIKDLLSMRSGIPDYLTAYLNYNTVNDTADTENEYTENEYEEYIEGESIEETLPPFNIYAESDIYNNKQAILEWIFNEPLNFAPSTSFEYSNSNYLLLAELIETAAGTDYRTFVKEKIFTPLEMTNTGFIEDTRTDTNLAQPKNGYNEMLYPGASYGSGDIVSCARDIDKWLTALRTDTLIKESTFAEMSRPYSQVSTGYGYGYGLMTYVDRGVIHQGQISDYSSFAYTNKSTGFNLFVVTNNTDALDCPISDFSFSLLQ